MIEMSGMEMDEMRGTTTVRQGGLDIQIVVRKGTVQDILDAFPGCQVEGPTGIMNADDPISEDQQYSVLESNAKGA